MKIQDVVRRQRPARLSPLKARVLDYLEGHPDEVFSYRDQGLASALGMKLSALAFTLWALHRDGRIGKEQVGSKVFLGSRDAVEELRRRLGRGTKGDAMARVRAGRERIHARIGSIDSLALLEASRQRED